MTRQRKSLALIFLTMALVFMPGSIAFGSGGHHPLHGHAAKKNKHKHKHKKKKSTHHKSVPVTKPAPTPTPTSTVVTGTLVLGGKMISTVTMTMDGALSLGDPTKVDYWDLPLPQDITLNGYKEHVTAASFKFSVPPTSSVDNPDGLPMRRFTWDPAPQHTVITVTETVQATIEVDLTPFSSNATLPLSNIPANVQPYLQTTPSDENLPTDITTLPDSAASIVQQIQSTGGNEQTVVQNVADWVATNTHYDDTAADAPQTPAQVLGNHGATCRGYDNLMIAILRKLGIPAQAEYGWVSSEPLSLPGPDNGSSSLQWTVPHTKAGMHTWLNVWFPDQGWVPFDPQYEKFFVDPRHIGLMTSPDAGSPYGGIGVYSLATTSATDDGTGTKLSNGDFEIVPGDGVSSNVTLQTQDSFQVTYQKLINDVSTMVLFSR